VGASFAVWALGASEISSVIRQSGICFIAGIGGGNVLLTFLQKMQLEVERSKVEELSSMMIEDLPPEAVDQTEDDIPNEEPTDEEERKNESNE
jgi:hypothetical protein